MRNKAQVTKAIILAGGYSKRMKLKVPKQLVKISNKLLLAYTLDAFERCKKIDSIILVAHKKIVRQCRNLAKKYKKIEQLCLGGKTRQQSVFNALTAIRNCDYVVVHDGVRPFVSQEIIIRTIKAAKKYNAATCAVKAVDTIVEIEGDFIGKTLARDKLWQIQTPQAFKFNLIFKAHRSARGEGIFKASDDAQLMLKLKNKVKIIKGSYQNLKITESFDLYLAKLLLQKKSDD